MYTIKDIQVFIPTYNRPQFLRESLASLVNQTAGVPKIVVYNNGNLSETSKVIKEFAKFGVSELKSKGGLIECMQHAEITSPYVMFFHDDDIVHKNYLEYALHALNTYNNIAFITTKTKNFTDPKTIDFEHISDEHYLFSSQEQFADYMYLFEEIAMQTAIYKTELFKKFPRETDKYGKFFDWPYLVTLSGLGNVVLFSHKNMFNVRIHPQQWTNDADSGWKINELINWHKQFFDAMKAQNPNSLGHMIFYAKFKFLITSGYKVLVCAKDKNTYSEKVFLEKAISLLTINTKDMCYDKMWILPFLFNNIEKCNFRADFFNQDNASCIPNIFALLVQEKIINQRAIEILQHQIDVLVKTSTSKTIEQKKNIFQVKDFIQTLFSVKNLSNKKHKVVTILGMKFKFKRKKGTK